MAEFIIPESFSLARFIEVVPEETGAIIPATTAQPRRLIGIFERRIVLVLAVLVVIGFGLRLSGISQIGFAEDEVRKLEAVRAYERGDITPNAEHPMVMKALIFVSMLSARAWNQNAGAANQISDEAALRFPNILFGALTVFPLFLLTAAFFGRCTGLIAAALWTFGINAITYNRIGKEDTLLVFFMLFAFYFFLRAKQTSGHDISGKQKSYILSGISFGLMLASKYFPHYFGLNMLYHHLVPVRERDIDEPRGNTPAIFYIVLFVTFLIVNPVVLLPQTWLHWDAYTGETLLTHRGYLMGDHLYPNQMSSTPFGTPVYFYLLFLAIKMPLPYIFALIIGLVEIVRRRREPGHAFLLLMFVLWIVPYSLVGAKWLRYTLSLMPFVYMIGAVGLVALIRWCASWLQRTGLASSAWHLASVAIVLFFIAWPALIAYANKPHYALYTNAFAAGRAGYFFPHDEFYDDGLREAIKFVCDHAPQGATLAHETPGVVRYYLEKYGRTDLRSRIISDTSFNVMDEPPPVYVILQRGRTYFENREEMNQVRASFSKVYEGFVSGVSAVEVYARRDDGQ